MTTKPAIRMLTDEERKAFGECEDCGAKHGQICSDGKTGKVSRRGPQAGTHLSRLRKTPYSVPVT